MTLENGAKLEERLFCGLENEQSRRKSPNWDFYWVLLSKVENV